MAGVIPHLDRVPLWAAFIPLGLYLLAVGGAHLSRRPLAIGGGWDWVLLGAAVAGLMVVGPLALLQPAMGNAPWTVILLLVLFVLLVALGALVSRPRLVIYNITLDQLRPLLADVVTALDTSARWAGSTAALPARQLEVRIDGHGPWRTVSLVAGGERSGAEGWNELCHRLRQKLGGVRVRVSPWAALFLPLGAAVLVASCWMAYASSSPGGPVPAAPATSSGEEPDAGSRRPDAS
ncbi:MAG: hypothetical protein O3A37_02800 [Planctomycetota bacterium]|jgi:hypothetical protein|nr:hypothetical protein [Planctomycetota bacterium]